MNFKRVLLSYIALLVWLAPNMTFADEIGNKNVILIMADDLGFECIAANGGTSYQTPFLDEMARTGARFNHCYSQPLCTPSRVQIMTGIYNVRNYERFGLLPRNQTTFGNIFQDAGYKTCVVGKWQLGNEADSASHFGFDNHCLWYFMNRKERYPNPGLAIDGEFTEFDQGEYGPDVVSDYACEFIETNKDERFFLYYPMILTHCPFCPTPDSEDWDPKDPGSKTYKGDPKYFGDMVTYMDSVVGKLLRKLDELDLREDTLVIFTGDNGTDKPIVSMMGDVEVAGAKGKMTDGGNRVPLIISCPNLITESLVTEDLVDFTDMLPTICEYAGIETPDNLNIDGRSFLPQLRGEEGNPRDWIYIWYSRNGGSEGKEFTRNQQYKLYRNGKFFDVSNDRLEKSPLAPKSLSESQLASRKMLQTALDQFNDARPREVAERGQKKKKQVEDKPKKGG